MSIPAQIPNGRVDINGVEHMRDAKGALMPVGNIRTQDLLQDEVVRKIVGYADQLSDQVARFKTHTFDDISALEGILAQQYGDTVGGAKGNKTLLSYDGLYKVQVQVADYFDFGPELQIAKNLIDQCLNVWVADARPEIRAIVTRAFKTDKAGQINRSEIFMLLRLEIEDPRWNRAMDAIRDAMRVVSSKTYVRIYRRSDQDAAWEAITIDLARA